MRFFKLIVGVLIGAAVLVVLAGNTPAILEKFDGPNADHVEATGRLIAQTLFGLLAVWVIVSSIRGFRRTSPDRFESSGEKRGPRRWDDRKE